ncbi:PrsW family intramembrane metalloprotease [Mycobacterium sp. WMMD1722]|uniref:PrsW family intramembrane metalloprotease n=1 Tax=Mycobacterium sp. WMMD1722 TaxID=3404117 RepID=UPI003BF4CAE1
MTDLSDLETARAAALDASGWGRRFVLFQPRNLAFWVYVLLVGFGAITVLPMLQSQPASFDTAVAAAVVLFVLYGALLWWFTQRADRYAKLPVNLLVTALAWGGFAATSLMAGTANSALSDLYAKAFGQAWSLDWSAALSAPFDEELAKGFGLLLLIALAPRVIRTAFDGFILGAAIGLGFQIVEDVQYALDAAGAQFGADPLASELQTIWTRMAFGVAAHILYSAIFCAGLVYLLGRPAEPRRVGRGLLLMVIAMLLHGVWDAVDAIAGGSPSLQTGLYVGMVVVALLIVAKVYSSTVVRERDVLRAVMAPEVERGVITPAELDVLAGSWKARRGHRKRGVGAQRRTAVLVLQAADELANELAAARGADTDRVRFARSEVERIRQGAPSRW